MSCLFCKKFKNESTSVTRRLIPIIFLVFLVACVGESEFEGETLEFAVSEGLLMPLEDIGDAAAAALPTPSAVRLRAMQGRPNLTVNVGFTNLQVLSFERDDRVFNGFFVEPGDFVREGDVLASARRDNTEIFMQRHARAQEELARFEEDFQNERDYRQIEIDDLREELETARDWERISINLAMRELDYEDFVRSSERTIRNMRREIADTEDLMRTEYIIAPFDGLVLHTERHIREGDELADGRAIAMVADINTMVLHANADMHILRHGDILPVEFAEHEMLVQVVSDPFAAGERDRAEFTLMPLNSDIMLQIFQEFEYEWAAFRNNPTRFARPSWNMYGDAIWLPREAIFFETARGELGTVREFVFVYEDGIFGRRMITTGPYATGPYTSVVWGLEPGEVVADAGRQEMPEAWSADDDAEHIRELLMSIEENIRRNDWLDRMPLPDVAAIVQGILEQDPIIGRRMVEGNFSLSLIPDGRISLEFNDRDVEVEALQHARASISIGGEDGNLFQVSGEFTRQEFYTAMREAAAEAGISISRDELQRFADEVFQ